MYAYFCKKIYRNDKRENNRIIYLQRVGVEEQAIFCWLILASQYYSITHMEKLKLLAKLCKLRDPVRIRSCVTMYYERRKGGEEGRKENK